MPFPIRTASEAVKTVMMHGFRIESAIGYDENKIEMVIIGCAYCQKLNKHWEIILN